MSKFLQGNALYRIIFIAVTALLIIMSVQTYRVIIRLNNLSEELNYHTRARNLLTRSLIAFQDVETSTRGYFFLSDRQFINTRNESLRLLNTTMHDLKVLYSTGEQKKVYAEIEGLYNNRLALLDKAIKNDQQEKRRILDNSAEYLDEVKGRLDTFILQEEFKITDITRQINAKKYIAPESLLFLALFAITFMSISYLRLSREFKKSRQLTEANKLWSNKLQESESLLKSILNSNPNRIIAYEAVRSADGSIINFRVVFASGLLTVGLRTQDDIIGMLITELFPNIRDNGFYDMIMEVTESGKNKQMIVYYPDDGRIRGWYETYVAKLNDGVLINGRNIDHLKEDEEKLKKTIEELAASRDELAIYTEKLDKSYTQLKEFNFISSHDLQEPLRKIQIYASRALDNDNIPDNLRLSVTKINESAARMASLLESITRYTTLQVAPLNLQMVDMNLIVKNVISDLELLINEKNASIIVDTLPVINCDPVQIGQLFLHLITNSLKFNHSTPLIKIIYESVILENDSGNASTASWHRFRVNDNGLGFDNSYSDKVFMIFEKVHDQEKYGGTGIGLSICKKIAENHNGTISAFSSPGAGATFDLYLPFS